MKKLFILVGIFAVYLFSYNIFASQIIKVKNKKVLIQFSIDEDIQTQDTYYVINNKGKKKAIVSILKVKNGKAIAKILTGKAREGWSLRFRKKASTASTPVVSSAQTSVEPTYSPAPVSRPRPSSSKKLFNHLNFLWGFSFNKLSINSVKHSDTSVFNFETSTTLFLPKKPIFGLKILSGTENFTIKGKCGTTGAPTCKTSIVYLSGGALAIVNFSVKKVSLWGGAGLKLLMPISSQVTSGASLKYIDKNTIKLSSALVLAGGLIFNLSRKFSVPFNVTYTLSPSAKDIKSPSATQLQTGLIYHF